MKRRRRAHLSNDVEKPANPNAASVIIPTYNYEQFVGQAIESVLTQTVRPHELIVIDDGSIDGTDRVLARYADNAIVRVVRQENRGLAATRNRGAELATGSLLAFLDADDVWLPGKLERQLAHLAQHPDVDLVHCAVQDIDAEGNALRLHTDGSAGDVREDLLLFRRGILGGGSGFIVRRSAFDELGGFDTSLSTSADWDFFYRLANTHRVGFVPEVLLQYRKHGRNMHRRVEVMEADMLHAFAKAFASPSPQDAMKRKAYGKLHMVLAGSYFATRGLTGLFRNLVKSVWIAPENIAYVAAFPKRKWQRRG